MAQELLYREIAKTMGSFLTGTISQCTSRAQENVPKSRQHGFADYVSANWPCRGPHIEHPVCVGNWSKTCAASNHFPKNTGSTANSLLVLSVLGWEGRFVQAC